MLKNEPEMMIRKLEYFGFKKFLLPESNEVDDACCWMSFEAVLGNTDSVNNVFNF
jgi:hypothetical protein